MGCFNNNGFYSHFPIECGDEIVLIPCYYGKNNYVGNNPEYLSPSMIGSSLSPLCFPLFGTYNDYGFIENVKEDFNTRALIKKLELSTLDELLKHIDSWGTRVCGPRKVLEEVVKGTNKYDIEEAEPTLRDMDRLGLKYPYSRLTFILERKDIYNKITELNNIGSWKEWNSEISYSDAWDKIIGFCDEVDNILTISNFSAISLLRNRNIDFQEIHSYISKIVNTRTYDCGNNMNFDIIFSGIEIKENIKDLYFSFMSFLQYIHSHGGLLIESSYCSQEIHYNEYLDLEKYKIEILEKIIEDKTKEEEEWK